MGRREESTTLNYLVRTHTLLQRDGEEGGEHHTQLPGTHTHASTERWGGGRRAPHSTTWYAHIRFYREMGRREESTTLNYLVRTHTLLQRDGQEGGEHHTQLP